MTVTHRVIISVTISTSISALLIFSSEDNFGWPPNRNDILGGFMKVRLGFQDEELSGGHGLMRDWYWILLNK